MPIFIRNKIVEEANAQQEKPDENGGYEDDLKKVEVDRPGLNILALFYTLTESPKENGPKEEVRKEPDEQESKYAPKWAVAKASEDVCLAVSDMHSADADVQVNTVFSAENLS